MAECDLQLTFAGQDGHLIVHVVSVCISYIYGRLSPGLAGENVLAVYVSVSVR